MTPTEVRLQLRTLGYAPIPLRGENPGMKTGWQWQSLHDVGADQIKMWGTVFGDAGNTGVLTRLTPAFDIDILDQDAADAVEQLAREFHEEHGDVLVRFGRAPKRAILFRTNEPFTKLQALLLAPNGEHQKLEVLGDGQQLVVDGIHPDTKQPYRWFAGTPWATRQEQLPYVREPDMRALLDAAVAMLERDFGYRLVGGSRPRNGNGPSGGEGWASLINNIRDGQALHDSLRDLAAKMVASGMEGGAVVNYLRSLMDASTCTHDGRWAERYAAIPRLVRGAEQKFRKQEPEPEPAVPAAEVIPGTIDETLAVFERWLDLSDMTALYAVLGTVAANMLAQFDPVWLGVIAPPSSAKTELLRALSKLPHVVEAATFTPAGLLSGTPKKQRDKYARGGLLNQIGEFGIIVLKDFGSILQMRPDTKAELLAALREIYDGSWTRVLGTDGGRQLTWKGKVGLVFASTQAIDSFYGFIGAMGDRFLFSRTTPTTNQFDRALRHISVGKQMRTELADAVVRLFAGRKSEPRPVTEQEQAAIKALVNLIVRLRGAVERDPHSRELQAVYGAEGAGRIGITLITLLAGLDTLGVDRTIAMDVVQTVALDSVPPIRRQAYEFLETHSGPVKTTVIAQAFGLPTTTVRRALEDLTAHGLAIRRKVIITTDDGEEKEGRDDVWSLAASPEF